MGLFNTTAYLSVTDAEDYFFGRTVADAWDNATESDKARALLEATRRIDRLNFAGLRTTDVVRRLASPYSQVNLLDPSLTQQLEFPRNGSLTVPEEVLAACCEIAYALLDGVDPEAEAQNLDVVQFKIAEMTEIRQPSIVRLAFRHGIPSVTAWNLLSPFLADPQEIQFTRVN